MTERSVVLTPIPQSDGTVRSRPAIALRTMLPYGDLLVSGIGSQLKRQVPGFDERIRESDADFADAGVKAESLIRLGFLTVLPRRKTISSIGTISPERHRRLRQTPADFLTG